MSVWEENFGTKTKGKAAGSRSAWRFDLLWRIVCEIVCCPSVPQPHLKKKFTSRHWVWLGVKRAESALEGGDCPHYKWHPLRMLRSRGENSLWGGSFHQPPRNTCHTAAEAEQWLCSQLDQMEGIKTDDPRSSSFPIRSSARFLRSEARPRFFPPEKGLDAPSVLFQGGGQGGCRWIKTNKAIERNLSGERS